MRLLHTKELRFQEFFDASIPTYAIFSHRWADEVSHQEFLYLNRQAWAGGKDFMPFIVAEDSQRTSSGFCKIMKFREIAAAGGYAWELIAPEKIEFGGAAWEVIGDKIKLAGALSSITSLGFQMLMHPMNIFTLSVGEITSLAVGWKTSRIEDQAYSLFGLLGVSMPLLYGEGKESFQRLQHSVLHRLHHSILQTTPDESSFVHRGHRVLARSVDDFAFYQHNNAHPTGPETYRPNLDPNTPHRTGMRMFAEYLVSFSFG